MLPVDEAGPEAKDRSWSFRRWHQQDRDGANLCDLAVTRAQHASSFAQSATRAGQAT